MGGGVNSRLLLPELEPEEEEPEEEEEEEERDEEPELEPEEEPDLPEDSEDDELEGASANRSFRKMLSSSLRRVAEATPATAKKTKHTTASLCMACVPFV